MECELSSPSWDDIFEAADLRLRPPQSIAVQRERICEHNRVPSPRGSTSVYTECPVSPPASTQIRLSITQNNGVVENCSQSIINENLASNAHGGDCVPYSTLYAAELNLTPDDSKIGVFVHRHRAIKNVCPSYIKVLAAKLAVNSGKEHVNKYGQVRKARFVKCACASTCRRCETPRLSDSERVQIFETFWSLNNHEDQWMYIFVRVRQSVPQKREAGTNGKSKGKCSRMYHFLANGVEKRVCRTMFKNILCICDSWIDSAMVHLGAGKRIPDMRGKHKQTQGRLTGSSRYCKGS